MTVALPTGPYNLVDDDGSRASAFSSDANVRTVRSADFDPALRERRDQAARLLRWAVDEGHVLRVEQVVCPHRTIGDKVVVDVVSVNVGSGAPVRLVCAAQHTVALSFVQGPNPPRWVLEVTDGVPTREYLAGGDPRDAGNLIQHWTRSWWLVDALQVPSSWLADRDSVPYACHACNEKLPAGAAPPTFICHRARIRLLETLPSARVVATAEVREALSSATSWRAVNGSN